MIETLEHAVGPAPNVTSVRARINNSLNGTRDRRTLTLIAGPCAPSIEHVVQIYDEADAITGINRLLPNIIGIARLAISKPRSDPKSWKGMRSSHPDLAAALIKKASEELSSVAMEIMTTEEDDEFSQYLALGWTGGRAEEDLDLKMHIASSDQTLPLPIKTGLSGDIDKTLSHLEMLKMERDPDAGAVVMLYRGGENAKTPDEWERRYIDAFQATCGRLIVDAAHGGEMAHDPEREFQKSEIGQLACLNHIIGLAEEGFVPAGIMVEASDTPRVIDPHIPMQALGEAIMRLRLVV